MSLETTEPTGFDQRGGPVSRTVSHEEKRMTGYCDDCGNQQCICAEIEEEKRMSEPVLALRYAANELDDVVVEDVSMFRAEMMDDKTLWLCCYFGDDKAQRITFYVHSRRGKLEFDVAEKPSTYVDWDRRSA